MSQNIFYIANNKIFLLDQTTSKEIKSQVLEDYKQRVCDNVKRKEWKSSESGAIFTGAAEPEMSAEAALKNIRVSVSSLTKLGNELAYTLAIDNVCGIYTHNDDSENDGILISDSNYKYTHIDRGTYSSVVSASFAGESHIGIISDGRNGCEFLTEGTSRERWPSWSKKSAKRILYSGCGLAMPQKAVEEKERLKSYPAMILESFEDYSYIESPYSIYSIDLDSMELTELISDSSEKFSYIKPYEAADGYIYYIKKPYNENKSSGTSFVDILLSPLRLIGAIFGFLNFFTIKYSGKTLTKNAGNTKAKNMSEEKLFIDGNIFEAGKELENNRRQGDKFPGAVPRTYQLCRRLGADGKEEVIKKGVIAYACKDNGEVLCSNGSHLLSLSPNGEGYDEKLVIKESAVSFIYID